MNTCRQIDTDHGTPPLHPSTVASPDTQCITGGPANWHKITDDRHVHPIQVTKSPLPSAHQYPQTDSHHLAGGALCAVTGKGRANCAMTLWSYTSSSTFPATYRHEHPFPSPTHQNRLRRHCRPVPAFGARALQAGGTVTGKGHADHAMSKVRIHVSTTCNLSITTRTPSSESLSPIPIPAFGGLRYMKSYTIS